MVIITYCEVHYEPYPYKTMNPRTHGAIVLGPTVKLNRTYNLKKTGRILKWRKWTEYMIPQQVINTTNKWGKGPRKKNMEQICSFENSLKKISIGTLEMT